MIFDLSYERASFSRYLPEAILAQFSQALPGSDIVEVSLVSRATIRRLKRDYFGIDEATDVLSFPLPRIPGQGDLLLGTICIAPVVTREWGETLPEVLHHGLLHLEGYDHDTDLPTWDAAEDARLTLLASHGLTQIRSRQQLAHHLMKLAETR